MRNCQSKIHVIVFVLPHNYVCTYGVSDLHMVLRPDGKILLGHLVCELGEWACGIM